MTNHWRDIKNADLILINGANPAEAHPVGFQWFMRAKLERGAKMIHADPRFTRTSAVADMYLRIRTGSDVAYFGGLINHVLQNSLYHEAYVRDYTNASFIVKTGFGFKDGLFSGYSSDKRAYDISSWSYEAGGDGFAKRDKTLQDERSVFQLMKAHYSRYTPEMVSSITGIPVDEFNKVADLVGQMGKPDKVMTIVYAVGLTHHTTGGQLIRAGAVLQLLLGNMGRPGGGMNAERGHANIQGNTDHAISWEILPGYLRIPAPGQKNLDDYVAQSAAKKSDPNSWNFFGLNYKKFMVSMLKSWYGAAATKSNEFAFDYVPKPGQNSSWMSIYDQALKGKMGDNSDVLTLAMKTNAEKATPEEAAQMLSLQRDYLAPCRKIALESAGKVHPTIVAILAESYAKAEANSANLVAYKISWGEFVMENQAIVNQRRAGLLAAGESIQRSLSRSP